MEDEKELDYIIAIPSFNRPKELKKKTLALLKRYNIPKEKIMIFVANNEEYEVYKALLDPETYRDLQVGEAGLTKQRIFISNFFKEGANIVSMDDDLEEILVKVDDKNKKPIEDLEKWIKESFELCIQDNCYLWGVYPVNNPYFMKDNITKDLRFIIGCIYGYINRHDKDLHPKTKVKEDYERTILYYLKDKKVMRFNNITMKTKFMAVGGLGADRYEKSIEAQNYLKETYPTIIKPFFRKNGFPEVKLLKVKV